MNILTGSKQYGSTSQQTTPKFPSFSLSTASETFPGLELESNSSELDIV